jgi:hypothetical protein
MGNMGNLLNSAPAFSTILLESEEAKLPFELVICTIKLMLYFGTRVCQCLSRGLKCDPYKLAADLWTSHGRKKVKEVDPRFLDPESLEDRRVWRRQK